MASSDVSSVSSESGVSGISTRSSSKFDDAEAGVRPLQAAASHGSQLSLDTQASLEHQFEHNFDLDDAVRMSSYRPHSSVLANGPPGDSRAVEDLPKINKVFTDATTGELSLPPDGGYGWVCCLCVTLVMFSTWGSNCAFGVFLAYYLNNNVFAGASKYDYALIAGITVCLGQGLPPFVIICMQIFGFKAPMLLGTVFLLLGFILASFSTKLWQLYLTQGVLVGMGMSFVYAPATTVLPGWFLRKRSFALGISLIGTGAGGVTYSLAVGQLIQETKDQRWALRMLGIACTLTCLVAIAVIRQRVKLEPIGLKDPSLVKEKFINMFSPRIPRMMAVNLIAAWFLFALFGYNLMIFTISPYAIAKGLTTHQSSSLSAILNGAQSVGRPLMGLMGDKVGRTNTATLLTLLNMILLFGFWFPAHTYVQLIVFSICLGLCMGVANVMSTVLVADLVDASDFLPSWAYINSVGSPLLLLPEVIAQLLTDESHPSNPYVHTQIFAGMCFVGALLLVLALREYAVKKAINERLSRKSQQIKKLELSAPEVEELEEGKDLLRQESKYRNLLGGGPCKYVVRVLYPMNV
ncbi:LANO_0A05358g1_1 [Lachancea nothofagi CBS 11611]|uniref:LANO_0A05358g1_1 n=1 Tax=Lachancea nothofagi CBS 11611 TaxID=1266666 RepID=A0A1G4IQW0_9SACH|nr:LANO_0A05358g1_1 [Lachancea nothofagi CBS 11611]